MSLGESPIECIGEIAFIADQICLKVAIWSLEGGFREQ